MQRRIGWLAGIVGLGLGLALAAANVAARPAGEPFASPAFERVWTRTDWLVKYAGLPRAWYWGPDPRRIVYEVVLEEWSKDNNPYNYASLPRPLLNTQWEPGERVRVTIEELPTTRVRPARPRRSGKCG